MFDIAKTGGDEGGAMGVLYEAKRTLRLALPLMIGQLSQMLLGVADTIMVGQMGVAELAALTFVNSLFWVPLVFGIGFLTSVAVHSSNALGADDPQAARESCQHGLQVSMWLGIGFFLLSLVLTPVALPMLGQPPEVTRLTGPYFLITMASGIPCLMSLALKNHADAMNRPWPPFWIFLSGVMLNVLLNWLLMYGKWGFPELGMNGAAWATLICRCLIVVGMLVWMRRDAGLRDWVPQRWLARLRRADVREHGKIGLPASLQMLCEVMAFSIAGLMMGLLGKFPMAAHQVAVTCAGVAFMVPLGLSMALTVRVGEVYGAEDWGRMKAVVHSGWFLAGCFAFLNATTFLVFGSVIAGWFSDAREVIHLSAALLAVVGIFQMADGLQIASSSMLRGMHDTRISAWLGFIAYWLVGIPLSYVFAFPLRFGAKGIWWGLAAGLMVACLGLGWRLRRKLRMGW